MPLISVIIPTYNRSIFLRSAIQSILSQTFQDFEIIIVDDCSIDETAVVVQSINSQKIRYIRHDVNKGESESRNTGIKSSNSEYVAFLDDDDEWLPHKLERQLAEIKSNPGDFGAVYSGFVFRDCDTGEIVGKKVPKYHGYIFDDLLYYNFITGGGSTILLKRNCFETAGLFDPSFKSAGDWDMWIRIAKFYKFTYVKDILAIYNQHSSNISKSVEAFIQGEELIIERYKCYLEHLPKAYSNHCHKLGILYSLNDNTARARMLFLKSIRLYPYNIKSYFYTLLSLTKNGDLTRKYISMNRKIREIIRSYTEI